MSIWKSKQDCENSVKQAGKCLNILSKKFTEYDIKYLSDVLADSTISSGLEELNLSKSYIDDENFIYLTKGLFSNSSITTLKLSGCDITNNGIKTLSEVFASGTSSIIKNLYIAGSYNEPGQIGDEGVIILAGALKDNFTNLLLLELGFNKIGDKGAIALGNMLSSDKLTLTRLGLIKNNITDKGAEIIANGLKSNLCLKSIDLNDNPISLLGANLLNMALENNAVLEDGSYTWPGVHKLPMTQRKLKMDVALNKTGRLRRKHVKSKKQSSNKSKKQSSKKSKKQSSKKSKKQSSKRKQRL